MDIKFKKIYLKMKGNSGLTIKNKLLVFKQTPNLYGHIEYNSRVVLNCESIEVFQNKVLIMYEL